MLEAVDEPGEVGEELGLEFEGLVCRPVVVLDPVVSFDGDLPYAVGERAAPTLPAWSAPFGSA